MAETKLPGTPDEIWQAIVGAFPPALQPYVSFGAALLAGLLVVFGLVKPLLDSFSRDSARAPVPTTGNAPLDALLALESRGKLDQSERRKLKDALFAHISAQGPSAASGASGSETRESFDRAIDTVLNEQSSKEAATQLAEFANDPIGKIDALLARAKTADEFREAGDLAYLLDTDRAMRAYEKAYALNPKDFDSLSKLGSGHYRKGDTTSARQIWNGLVENGETKGTEVFCKALLGLSMCDFREGNLTSARLLSQRAIGASQVLGARKQEAQASIALGMIAATQDDDKEAEIQYDHGLKISQAIADKRTEADALMRLGLISERRGDFKRANELHGRSLALARETGDRRAEADALLCLGMLASSEQKVDASIDFYKKALDAYQQIGDKENAATTLGNLGLVAETQGNLPEAERIQIEVLAINRELNKKEGQAGCLYSLAGLADRTERTEVAERNLLEALPLYRQIGSRTGEADTLNYLGVLMHRRGDLDGARKHWDSAITIYEAIGGAESEGAKIVRTNLQLLST